MRYLREHFDKLLFVFGLCIISLSYGMLAANFHLFPFSVIQTAVRAAVSLQKNSEQYIENKPTAVLEKTQFDRGGLLRYKPGKAQPGVTLVTSFYGSTPGIRLLALNGTVLHSWSVSFQKLWPSPSHLKEAPSDLRTHIHGAHLEPNGDVVCNIEYKGLLKLDRQGRVLWRVPYQTHHSIFQDEQGNYWVPGRKFRSKFDPSIPMIERPFFEEYVLQISPAGEILREISVYELLFENEYEGVLLGHGPTDVMLHGEDLIHLNDIEVLGPDLASRFPLFAPGDVMVSLRNLNMAFVFDPGTRRIKWHQIGPFLRHHDPDFLDNGRISIFDNRDDQAEGKILGGSRILELDPSTGHVQTTYRGMRENPFFTGILGKHQHLENGNLLITEGQKGRIFEVTPQGEVVWEYVNKYDEDSVAWVEQGHRYPIDYVQFATRGDG